MEDPEIYMCGPPPMIDAMAELATEQHGVDEARIFHDKFTTSADAESGRIGIGRTECQRQDHP